MLEITSDDMTCFVCFEDIKGEIKKLFEVRNPVLAREIIQEVESERLNSPAGVYRIVSKKYQMIIAQATINLMRQAIEAGVKE